MPARVNATTVPRKSRPTTANGSATGSNGDPVATIGAIAAMSSVVPARIAGALRGDLLFAKLFA
jgi:hypothetical protein